MRKFKNLQIGDNDLYTKRFGGHDLHLYLQKRGMESCHLVWNKMSEDETTFEIASNFDDREVVNNILLNLEKEYSTHSTLLPFSYGIIFDKNFLSADVVHCHLLHNDFFNIFHLPFISRLKPLVWTLHDPWAFTGHCVHPMACDKWESGCLKCGDLNCNFPLKDDLAGVNFAVKEVVYGSCDIDIVVSSEWMHQRVRRSPLLKNKRVHLVPFGLDLDKFKPKDSIVAKQLHGIDADSLVLGLRASAVSFKGMDNIIACLEMLDVSKKIVLLIFNAKGYLEKFRKKFHDVVEVGWIFNEEQMIDAYNAVDIFLMPSTAESFGMMAMEAMACGKISVVMSDTALEEVVKPEKGGIVAKQGDVEDFTEKVQKLIDDDNLRENVGIQARKIAEEYYGLDKYIDSLLNVYKTAIDNFKEKEWAEKNIELLKKVKMPEIDSSIRSLHGGNYDELMSDYNNIVSSVPYRIAVKLSKNFIMRTVYFNFIKKVIGRR